MGVCDTITLITGEKKIVKVKADLSDGIKYVMCDNLNGTDSTIAKTEVAQITYANGITYTLHPIKIPASVIIIF